MTLLRALGAPVGLILVVDHQRSHLPSGILFEGDFGIDVGHKEPRFGFGKRLELILRLVLAGGCADKQP
jgi:hypothetical protein